MTSKEVHKVSQKWSRVGDHGFHSILQLVFYRVGYDCSRVKEWGEILARQSGVGASFGINPSPKVGQSTHPRATILDIQFQLLLCAQRPLWERIFEI
jgi:hypothetical protein